MYYEHCSYFSPASLVRLFEDCGFEVFETWLDFDDQYLFLMARPREMTSNDRRVSALRDDALQESVSQFENTVTDEITQWTNRVRGFAEAGRRPVIWGAGSKCVSFLTTTGLQEEIEFVVDVNPYKQGKFLPSTGHKVIAPEELRDYQPQAVVVMNPVYVAEIGKQLAELGVEAELAVV